MERMTPLEKVEWTCLGLYGMAMERSCSLWRRREFWDHSVPPNTTRSTRLCVGVTQPRPFLPQGQTMETWVRAHKQTTCPGNHPRSTPPEADVSRHVRHVLEDTSGDGYRRPGDQRPGELGFSKKSHQRSQSTGCVPVRKAPTNPHSQATAPQAKGGWGLQSRRRWGIQHETGCQCPVHLIRL